MNFGMFQSTIEILTEELIIAKADADFDPSLEKHEYIATLYRKIEEALK